MQQAVCCATDHEGGGGLFYRGMSAQRQGGQLQIVADLFQEKYLDMCVSPMEKIMCTAFEEYEEVPETMPHKLSENDATWVASELSGTAGELELEAIELSNWILLFGCSLEEFRVVVADLGDWVPISSPLLAAYRAMMACHLVALDNRPGVGPSGIGETLSHAVAKFVMRVAGDQTKTVCGSLQLCVGLEGSI